MTPEKRIQTQIENYLSQLENHFFERRQAGGYSYKKGIPDLYAVYKGYHIEIEVKRVGGERSSMQYKYETIFRNAGAIYILADSVDDVKKVIENIDLTEKSQF